jgi:hypothetical protein
MAMNKFYIFGGCSFTDMDGSWARVIRSQHLSNPTQSKNCAKSGAGNKFIASAVIDTALKVEKLGFTPDISIMWSSPTRFELPINFETPFVNQLFEESRRQNNDFNPGTFLHHNINGEIDRSSVDNFWLMQCSKVTSKTKWTHDKAIDEMYVDAFEKFQEILWNSNYQWHNTLTSILSVQWLCEIKKWPYRFTTFREGLGEYIRQCSPQFLSLQQEINWDKFVFTDNNYGGLREFTLSTINTWDDGHDNHPSHDAHKLFVNDFWLKRFPNVYQ